MASFVYPFPRASLTFSSWESGENSMDHPPSWDLSIFWKYSSPAPLKSSMTTWFFMRRSLHSLRNRSAYS